MQLAALAQSDWRKEFLMALKSALSWGEVLQSPATRKKDKVEKRVCRYCGDPYEPRSWESPRRRCCYRPVCEAARERERKGRGGGGQSSKP